MSEVMPNPPPDQPVKAALAALIVACQEPNLRARAAAVAVVAGLGRDAVPDLMEALEHECPDVRRVAIVTLGEIGLAAEGAVGQLQEALEDEWLAPAARVALAKV